MLYPPGAEPTIPVIAVTGTNGKTTTTRLIAHLFRNMGKTVGFTTTDGVYLQNRLVMEGDMTGPFAANIILTNPTVEVAVLETARGGILRAGLGFEECDVGVVLNVSADHLGLRGIHTVRAARRGEECRAGNGEARGTRHPERRRSSSSTTMRDRTGGDIVLFSAREYGENEIVEEHVKRGGIAAVIEQDTFVIRRGRSRIPIATEHGGPTLARWRRHFPAREHLAAAARRYVQGMRYDDIRAGLLSFHPVALDDAGPDEHHPCGPLARARRMLTTPPPSAASRSSSSACRRRGGTVSITVPGDRRDDDIREAGRLARDSTG